MLTLAHDEVCGMCVYVPFGFRGFWESSRLNSFTATYITLQSPQSICWQKGGRIYSPPTTYIRMGEIPFFFFKFKFKFEFKKKEKEKGKKKVSIFKGKNGTFGDQKGK